MFTVADRFFLDRDGHLDPEPKFTSPVWLPDSGSLEGTPQ
jgi:hypothetical protein